MFKEKHQTVCREPYLHSLGDLVHILGLDDGPQVVLQDLGEIVLELRAPEVGQDLLPIGGVLRETGVPVRKGSVNLFWFCVGFRKFEWTNHSPRRKVPIFGRRTSGRCGGRTEGPQGLDGSVKPLG